jgi:cytochrome c oxidase subunit 1
MLTLRRYLGAKFFDAQAGGSAILWQHFFWIFGHPEVYILVLPAFGVISEVVPVFSRKPIFGYPMMVAASILIGFISAGVWAHHMFTVGLNSFGVTFFAMATLAISVPTGIKIFNWLATMYGGKIKGPSPAWFSLQDFASESKLSRSSERVNISTAPSAVRGHFSRGRSQ